jgi:hypothetical protein
LRVPKYGHSNARIKSTAQVIDKSNVIAATAAAAAVVAAVVVVVVVVVIVVIIVINDIC